jgi:hypothetical protein
MEDLGGLGRRRVHRVTSQTSNPQIQFVGVGAVTGTVLQGVFIGDVTAPQSGCLHSGNLARRLNRGEPGGGVIRRRPCFAIAS